MQLLQEQNFSDVSTKLEEDTNGKKTWFLEGVFLQADVVNRNRRIYPLNIMENAVRSYINEFVTSKRAIGELSHPETPSINLDKVSHIVEDIKQEGNNFTGKAKILNTDMGRIVEGLLEGGVKLGVSSRGLGTLKKDERGISEVQSDFKMGAIDIVFQPSAPDAFVNGIMEGESFIWDTIKEDTDFLHDMRQHLDEDQNWKKEEAKLKAFESFMEKIKTQ